MSENRNPAALHGGAEDIVETIRAAGDDPGAVATVLAGLVREPERVEQALGEEDRCGITVLFSSPALTVQRIVWPAGIKVPPHDHRMWAVVGVYRGREDNRLFRRDDPALSEAGARRIETGEVFTLGSDAIHAVANTMSVPCVALHVYGGDLDGTARSTWTPEEHRFEPQAMWRAIGTFRAREDELGRPLTLEETTALIASR